MGLDLGLGANQGLGKVHVGQQRGRKHRQTVQSEAGPKVINRRAEAMLEFVTTIFPVPGA